MAKTSKIVANERRKVIVARYAERRAELKTIIARPTTPDDEPAWSPPEVRGVARAVPADGARRAAAGGHHVELVTGTRFLVAPGDV